jgi:hypothetical protein
VTARVLIPPDLNGNPAETVAKPGDPSERLPDPIPSDSPEAKPTVFALGDAIAFALRNNPRLRSARAAIERAQGQEQVAFATFLPQFDFFGQYGVSSNPWVRAPRLHRIPPVTRRNPQIPSVKECQNTPARAFTLLIRCNYRRSGWGRMPQSGEPAEFAFSSP